MCLIELCGENETVILEESDLTAKSQRFVPHGGLEKFVQIFVNRSMSGQQIVVAVVSIVYVKEELST